MRAVCGGGGNGNVEKLLMKFFFFVPLLSFVVDFSQKRKNKVSSVSDDAICIKFEFFSTLSQIFRRLRFFVFSQICTRQSSKMRELELSLDSLPY